MLMKNNIKNIIISIIFIISFIIVISYTRYVMKYTYNDYYNKYELDSILKIEQVDTNFNNWHLFKSFDYETNDSIVKFFYIKQLGKNEIIYNVLTINSDSLFKFNKRITTTKK